MSSMIHCDRDTLQPSEKKSGFAYPFYKGYKIGLQKLFLGCNKKRYIAVYIS